MPRGTNRFDEARHQGRLWTPSALRQTGLLVAWFDAADLSTLVQGGTGLSQWSDKSGFGRHLSQATGALQPVWTQSVFDSRLPAVTYDSGQYMAGSISAGVFSAGITVVSVFQKWGTAVAFETGVNRTVAAVAQPIDRYNATVFPYTSTNSVPAVFDYSTATTATIFVQRGNVTANNYTERVNGSASGVNAHIMLTAQDTATTFHMNTRADVFTSGRMYWRRAILCSDAVTDRDRDRLEGYAAWTDGLQSKLPASHPYKNSPPLIGP